MQIPILPSGSTGRLSASSPPPGVNTDAKVGTDGYVGGTAEAPQLIAPQEVGAPATTSHMSALSKTLLATTMGISALTGFASAAGAAPLAAGQVVASQLQQNNSGMSVDVVPQGTPRIDLLGGSDYSPVGVSLGGGLFQDAHGNLGFLPTENYGLNLEAHDFQRVDLGKSDQSVQRFANTVQYTESSTKRVIYTELGNTVQMTGARGNTTFQHNNDGSVHVKGPHTEYTVRQDGLYTRIDQPGQQEISIIRADGKITVIQGNDVKGTASTQNGVLSVNNGGTVSTVTQSDSGVITEVHGKHGVTARIVHDGGMYIGNRDSDKMTVNDPAVLAQQKARYDAVMQQLDAVEPGFAQKHPVVASVLEYASANPAILGQQGGGVGFLQAGTLLGSAGAGVETISALSAQSAALNLANSARALGAAALSAQAAAQAQAAAAAAAAAAGNMAQAQQLAASAHQLGAEAQQFAGQAHGAKDAAMSKAGSAMQASNVARALAGAGGALQIVDGVIGIHKGHQERSLVQGAIAVTEARMGQLTDRLQGDDKRQAQEDTQQVLNTMKLLEKQADKKVHVGELKIGLGGLMIVSAILGPEAPPIIGAIGIAGTGATAIYEHWGPIKSFLTGSSDKVPSFLNILPNKDEVDINLGAVPGIPHNK